jgi:hypothetical protein
MMNRSWTQHLQQKKKRKFIKTDSDSQIKRKN